MGGSGLKRKSKKSDISSQKKKKKKGLRKDSKKRRRIERSVSSHSNVDLSDSEYTSSSYASLSGHKRKRAKSKKQRRVISSDSDISRSTDSDSFSSDEKAHKSRRRKPRITLKRKKNITRKRYSSSDEGTSAKKARKRKRPVKDMPLKSRKKSSKKKSLKKLSSDSGSYSTNPSGESSEGEKHSRKATRGREVERWASDISYKGRKRHKVRSPSCSSFSRNSTENDSVGVKEPLAQMGNYNPRRLRSVICIPNRTFDELEKDSKKEVIEHDCYDYPSPKSFESDEEQNKGEPDDYSRGESIEKFHVENYEEQIDKEIDSSACVKASSGDLELTLRQRALENLMKFRGVRKVESHGKPNNEIDVINEPKNPELSVPLEIEQTSGPASNGDFSRPLEFEKRSPNNQQERLKEEKISSDSDFSNANKDLSLEECRKESDKGSEFEEKTMSVMRGGEMVQVSYKVHIPKKTSHLARRQLRR